MTIKIATFDYDTREAAADAPGLERPVAITFHGEVAVVFRNDPKIEHLPWRRRHIVPGGLTDGFMRWVLGDEPADEPAASPERRRRYMADRYHIYGTTRFVGFCFVFLLGWLRRHRARYDFEILARQAHIARLDVWPKGTSREEGHWSFFPGPPPASATAEGEEPKVTSTAPFERSAARARRVGSDLATQTARMIDSLTDRERAVLAKRFGMDPDTAITDVAEPVQTEAPDLTKKGDPTP